MRLPPSWSRGRQKHGSSVRQSCRVSRCQLTSIVPSSSYPTLQRYTKFAVASLATFVYGFGSCKKPPFKSTLVKKYSNILTSTQVAIFQDDAAGEFIVSFPGSSSPQDFGTDINAVAITFTAPGCSGCKVHSGVLMG